MLISETGIAFMAIALIHLQGLQASASPQPAGLPTITQYSAEAFSMLGTLNRAQQAYKLEKSRFANRTDQLDAISSERFYSYVIIAANKTQVITKATPKFKGLKPVIAGVAVSREPQSSTEQFHEIICESTSREFSIASPEFDGMKWVCGTQSKPVD
jgi:hypothetical protein